MSETPPSKITERTWFPLSMLIGAILGTSSLVWQLSGIARDVSEGKVELARQASALEDTHSGIDALSRSFDLFTTQFQAALMDRWRGSDERLIWSEFGRLNQGVVLPNVQGVIDGHRDDSNISTRPRK